MKNIKTINGYISALRNIEKISPVLLKGFEKLPKDKQCEIKGIECAISNLINDYD